MNFNKYKNICAKDILFVVGAGISKSAPSNIPLGNELTEYVLNESCGNIVATKILSVWSNIAQEIVKYDKNLKFSLPRLETILGCISEIDSIMARTSILNGLKSWANVPPNINHFILADFLKAGSNIFTTNFDLGIQNASNEANIFLTHENINNISVFSSKNTGKIYHLHGCSLDDINKLGTTVRNVKMGFSSECTNALSNIVLNSRLIVFLGYSASDSFDVVPFFQKTPSKEMIFVQHKTHCNRRSFPSNLVKLFHSCENAKAITYETTSFIKKFLKKVLKKEYCLRTKDIEYKWVDEFAKTRDCSYSSDDLLINFLGLRYHLGIATNVFETDNPKILEELHELRNKNLIKDSRINDYYEKAIRSFSKYHTTHYNKPDGFSINDQIEFIDKKYLISLRDFCEYYIEKYTDVREPMTEEDKSNILQLITLLKIYKNYSFNDVQYISYISACLKFVSALSARLNYEYTPNYSKEELSISLDIAYIEGAIAALIHLAEHLLINRVFNPNIKKQKAFKALKTAEELARISGYSYHLERINGIVNTHK